MTNKTDSMKWFHRCRLAWLERQVMLQGRLNRCDIMSQFGISAAAASADLEAYQALNPGSLTYDLKLKTFHWTGGDKLAITPAPWVDFPT